MVYGVLTLLPLLYYQKKIDSAVNRNLASVTNNWNDFTKCFYELVNSYIVKEGNYYANSKKFVLLSSLFMLGLRSGCHSQLKMMSNTLQQIF